METMGMIALVLFALMLGFVIPVLLQLRATLKSAQELIDATAPRVDTALRDIAQLTVRVNAIAGEVEDNLPRMKRMIEATDGVVDTLEGVQRSIKMVGAVAPAAFAAVKAAIHSLAASRGTDAASASEPEIDN
jgi:uncharacterized protein YoxC